MKKFKQLLLLTIMAQVSLHATSDWTLLLEQYKAVIDEPTYQLLSKQYQSYINGDAPAIVDPRVKTIAIIENNDAILDLYQLNHPRIRVLTGDELHKAHSYGQEIDVRSDKHGCMRKQLFMILTYMLDELDRLAPVFGYESGELEIRLFEGLRDIATQKHIFDTMMAKVCQNNSHYSYEEAYKETSIYVSPYLNNVPVHSTGAAIDILLWSNKTNDICDMGPFNVAGSIAPTMGDDPSLTIQQKLNRLLMFAAATKAGLTNYLYEFWHFSYGDRYAAYWRGENNAVYGSV